MVVREMVCGGESSRDAGGKNGEACCEHVGGAEEPRGGCEGELASAAAEHYQHIWNL